MSKRTEYVCDRCGRDAVRGLVLQSGHAEAPGQAQVSCRQCGGQPCPDPTGTFGAAFADRLCAACWRAHWAAFDRMRDEYAGLVRRGVHSRVASRHVSVRRRLG